jgi:hypothetical protein
MSTPSRTRAGHEQDTSRTRAGHEQDTSRTRAGHEQDTSRVTQSSRHRKGHNADRRRQSKTQKRGALADALGDDASKPRTHKPAHGAYRADENADVSQAESCIHQEGPQHAGSQRIAPLVQHENSKPPHSCSVPEEAGVAPRTLPKGFAARSLRKMIHGLLEAS